MFIHMSPTISLASIVMNLSLLKITFHTFGYQAEKKASNSQVLQLKFSHPSLKEYQHENARKKQK